MHERDWLAEPFEEQRPRVRLGRTHANAIDDLADPERLRQLDLTILDG